MGVKVFRIACDSVLAAHLRKDARRPDNAAECGEQHAAARNRDCPYFLSALARASAFSRHIGQARL